MPKKVSHSPTKNDWRVTLFGDMILSNSSSPGRYPYECNIDVDTMTCESSSDLDLEAPPESTAYVTTQKAFDSTKYDYIAVFIGANYCPHCKEFAPIVVSSAMAFEKKRTKVVFVSNDRDEENFDASCKKNAGIDVVPYDTDKTKGMRHLFDLKTIPALMILRNDNFAAKAPTVVSNGRHNLVADRKLHAFPWNGKEKHEISQFSAMDRFVIRGKYGTWWSLGHRANPEKPEEMYMDEHAVRIRAGILNTITWIALINIFFWRDPTFVKILFPLVSWEFLSSMTFGLTPLAPIGTAATLLAIKLTPAPYWKPAKPKRFAWAIGLTLSTLCFTWFMLRVSLGAAYRPLIGATVITCNLATWFECSAGFCLGCFIYNNYLVPWLKLEECQECKL